ncbi:MAG: hypothetical protein CM15mV13_3270 [uncultured marine virus]|nr:MAG: hypothetical protein CM15mV13_3270 [uncultured marine virus]
MALLYGADVATSWTIEGFWALGSTQYAANNTTPHLYTVTDNVGNEVKVGLDASSGANAGKVFLVLGGSTIYSTATTYVTPFMQKHLYTLR